MLWSNDRRTCGAEQPGRFGRRRVTSSMLFGLTAHDFADDLLGRPRAHRQRAARGLAAVPSCVGYRSHGRASLRVRQTTLANDGATLEGRIEAVMTRHERG